MANSETHRSHSCFLEWMSTQKQDLAELLEALHSNYINDNKNSEKVYAQLTQKSLGHFQEYMVKRSHMYHEYPSAFYAPPWCTSLEHSTMWIAGCRPSSFIRLLYGLGGSEIEALLSELMEDSASRVSLSKLSANRLTMVNNLHLKTIKEEDKMTKKLASLQEDIADQPISLIANKLSRVEELNEEVERALDEHESAMANIIQEADNLRLNALKGLLNILTPEQAVDFLASGKKLHLCIHDWGKRRDRKHGRTSN